MAEEISHRLSTLALAADEIVVIVRLENAAHYNLQPAMVLQTNDDGRLVIRLLHGRRQVLACRRSNLLRAEHPEDRAALLTLVVWERQLELRVARKFLLEQLRGEEGLAEHIASFFPMRATMAMTSGFAMGRIVPTWSCATLNGDGRFIWRPIHELSGGGRPEVVHGGHQVTDGIVRIDCAVVDIGVGCFVVAGGCADHPARTTRFFRRAF